MGGDRRQASIWLAFGAIYLIWGTTFLAIAVMLRTMPPFAGAALRFVAGGVLLWLWLRLRSPRPLADLPYGRLAISGVLLLAGGNGLVVWAQQGVASGVAALLIASVPVVVLVLNWLFFAHRRPDPRSLLGTGIGLCGVALIVTHLHSLSGAIRPLHVFALLGAIVSWSVATLISRGAVPPDRITAATCLQMLAGGVALCLIALVAGDWSRFHPSQVSLESWLAVLYLTLFGSIIALSCFLWLLTEVGPQKATTYALVNPMVALLLGALVLGERITGMVVVAMVLILAGVSLVLFQGRARA